MSLPVSAPDPMSPALLSRRGLIACLVAAPVLELAESVLSPLAGTSTTADLAAIDAHRALFVASVLAGLTATVLYVPAFLGLAGACVRRSPVAARLGGAIAVLSMLGFAGVRAVQGIELEAVRRALPRDTAAQLVDGFASNPVGAVLLVMFLGGSVVGVIALAVAAWRAGLPRPAAVLLVAFPVVDLAAPGHAGTVVSHALLLAALSWLAVGLARPRAGGDVAGSAVGLSLLADDVAQHAVDEAR